MGKPLRIFTASESEKFEATKGQKGNSLGSMSADPLHLIQATNAAPSVFRKGRCTLELQRLFRAKCSSALGLDSMQHSHLSRTQRQNSGRQQKQTDKEEQ